MKIKKNDTVVIIAGKDRGKEGKVLRCIPEKERVIVEGVNLSWKHMRRSQKHPQGGRVKRENPIHVSNVMFKDPKSGQATRLRKAFAGQGPKKSRDKVRVAVKSGNSVE